MENSNTFLDIANKLELESVTPSGKFKTTNGESKSVSDVMLEALTSGLIVQGSPDAEKATFVKRLTYAVKNRKLLEHKAHRDEVGTEFAYAESEAFNSYIEKLDLLVDPRNGDKKLLDAEKNELIDVDVENYYAIKEMFGIVKRQVPFYAALFTFNPTDTFFIREALFGRMRVQELNLFIPPKWMKRNLPLNSKPRIPDDIQTLLDHLFGKNTDEQEYVLDWFHHSLVARNHTTLMLLTAKGVGKNLLIDGPITSLMGKHYAEKVDKAALESNFVGTQFKDKRLIFFDETDVSDQELCSKIKAYTNSTIRYEAKGKDARTIKNHTSIVIASNNTYNTVILPDDRRYSVPRVTTKKLADNVWTYEEIEEFVDKYNPDNEPHEDLIAFGKYLLQRKPKTGTSAPFKKEYFFEICFRGLSGWQRNFIEYLEDVKKDFTEKDFQRSVKDSSGGQHGPRVQVQTYDKFLDSYLFDGVHRIADIEVSHSTSSSGKKKKVVTFKPTKEYLKFIASGKSMALDDIEYDEESTTSEDDL